MMKTTTLLRSIDRSTTHSIIFRRSLSTATTPPTVTPKFYPKVKKPSHKLRNSAIALGLGSTIYFTDKYYNAEAIGRTVRTFSYGVLMALDFKLNFNPENSSEIDALHERVAWRIHHICTTNGGLYIKLAQSIAIQAAILPLPYRLAFANIFDNAPSVPFNQVVDVFEREFGVHPDVAFDDFSRTAVASASIAQVHKARLKREDGLAWDNEDEGWVAVKIRKPTVPKQISYDLFAYKYLLKAFERLFDLPVAFVADYVCEAMHKEVNLDNEGRNAEKMAKLLSSEPGLKDAVMIPNVHWKWTGEAVMTADFIHAVKLTDTVALKEMNLAIKPIMDNVVALFAAMTFKWGLVHGDGHPGNILIRPHPKDASRAQIVLIDHGLCIPLSEEFRAEYSLLWRSLFVADVKTIERIAQSWGIAREHSNMLASATLLRPHTVRKPVTTDPALPKTTYEQQTGLKERLRAMLQNEELIPRELILLARSMRMIQANNQTLGSPSNRINIMAHYASEGYAMTQLPPPSPFSFSFSSLLNRSSSSTTNSNQPPVSLQLFKSYFISKTQSFIFHFALFAIDVGFMLTRFRSFVLETCSSGGAKREGFEDLLQRQVSAMARDELGIELGDEAFQG